MQNETVPLFPWQLLALSLTHCVPLYQISKLSIHSKIICHSGCLRFDLICHSFSQKETMLILLTNLTLRSSTKQRKKNVRMNTELSYPFKFYYGFSKFSVIITDYGDTQEAWQCNFGCIFPDEQTARLSVQTMASCLKSQWNQRSFRHN